MLRHRGRQYEQYEPPDARPIAKNRMFTLFQAQYPNHERKVKHNRVGKRYLLTKNSVYYCCFWHWYV